MLFRIQGGELFERVIDEDFVLTERACACFMKQICDAMDYLHSNKVIHLDMKVNWILCLQFCITDSFNQQPENVLCLSKSGNRIKLIDFGFARRYDPNKKLQVRKDFLVSRTKFNWIYGSGDVWHCRVLRAGSRDFRRNRLLHRHVVDRSHLLRPVSIVNGHRSSENDCLLLPLLSFDSSIAMWS